MKFRRYLLGGSSILALPFLAATAYAADTAAVVQAPVNEQEMGEIVVTAQRREENIQRVPISIQAITPEVLEDKQVKVLDDYVKLMPSVTITSLGPGRSSVYFRGVATGAGAATSGMYLDETPVAFGRNLDPHLYDIARVEALSGPQGTLFGANSLSGALRIITNKPDPAKFSAGVDVQGDKYGPGAYGGMFEGFANVPVSSNAAIRVVGFYEKEGGYVDNKPATLTYTLGDNDPTTNKVVNNAPYVKDNANPVVHWGGRVTGLLNLGDNWSITPQLTYQVLDAKGDMTFIPRFGDLVNHEFSNPENKDRWALAALTIQGDVGIGDLIYNGSYMSRHTSTVNDYAYYSIYYDRVPNYTKFPLGNGDYLDPTQHYYQYSMQREESHELRFVTPSVNRWHLTAGGFYQWQRTDNHGNYYNPGISTVPGIYTAPGLKPVWADVVYLTWSFNRQRDYAGFIEGSYEITDQLTLTAGFREFGYKQDTWQTPTTAGVANRRGCGRHLTYPTACGVLDFHNTNSGETHKVNLQYQLEPDKMVYATYSTGYRQGGFNTNNSLPPYNPDTIDNYEVGYKTTWANVFRINGAFYFEQWNGMQYRVVLPNSNGATGTFNAGQARIYGAEADATWLVTDNLNLSVTAAYNDAHLSKDLVSGTSILAPSGTRLPFQPKFKGTATARYEMPVMDWNGFIQGSITTQTDSTDDIRTLQAGLFGLNPGFSTVDFAIGAKRDNTNVQFFIQNAFDKRGVISKTNFCSIEICQSTPLTYPAKPQFFGIKVGQRF
jgi:outer membrane receptor protein involved in Fe transport